MTSARAGSGAPRLEASGRSTAAGRAALLGVALAFALSPLLVDLVAHVAARPWARYALAFPAALAWAAWRAGGAPPAPRAGAALVGLALAIELVAVGGGVPRFGRPALALAALGLCRGCGLASWRVSALALWLVPLPHFAVAGLGAPLTALWAPLAAETLGLAVEPGSGAHELRLVAEEPALALGAEAGGLPLAAFLSGAGWLAGLRGSERWSACLRQALALGLAALPLALAGVVSAAALLAAGAPTAAGLLLPLGPWGAAAGLATAAVVRAERRRRRPA